MRVRRIPYGRPGPVIARLVAIADGYELRHFKLLSRMCPHSYDGGAVGDSSPACQSPAARDTSANVCQHSIACPLEREGEQWHLEFVGTCEHVSEVA